MTSLTINQMTIQFKQHAESAYKKTNSAMTEVANKVGAFYSAHRREIMIGSCVVSAIVAPKAFLVGTAIGYVISRLCEKEKAGPKSAYTTKKAAITSIFTFGTLVSAKVGVLSFPFYVGALAGDSLNRLYPRHATLTIK